jgi:hypothetical protein
MFTLVPKVCEPPKLDEPPKPPGVDDPKPPLDAPNELVPVAGLLPKPPVLAPKPLLGAGVDPNPVVAVALPKPPVLGVDAVPNPLVEVWPAGNGADAAVAVD